MQATSAEAEQRALKRSIAATVLVGAFGVVFGILSGSLSIAFDGVFSVIDASMTLLALFVARLVAREPSRRFQLGYWHLEPMVLAANGGLLTLLSFYAFVNAVGTLFSGGRELVFDWAIGYAVVTVLICLAMFLWGRRANRAIGSDFLALDVKGWAMSGLITGALLAAFVIAAFLEGGRYADLTPYVDPAVLALLTLVIIPVPLRTVIGAVKEILLVAPVPLDEAARAIGREIAARHGIAEPHTFVAKVGRARFVEFHFLVAPDSPLGSIAAQDAVREEIGAAIGGSPRDRWLTVAFTGDAKWVD
ncbi:cation diffusion facilitator family transporter [Antarcticirhabdus aurantiaca]|uniref:Cation transporter n=1 Tax=Antarcticirhabdus aurantiaca TaxID=2606717 RepID=A0ACD4NSN5_9HYPH|nr:cation transporter [Antarcticirhabdus aurantiaca]WAJ29682.1 cation transporter [Jeongeuplla avenae]